ncbi:MAG: prepilin peptidase [Sphingomicrobium sp.]
MNLFASAPLWLIAIFTLLLVLAAAEDAVRLTISNLLVAAVLVAALAAMALGGFSLGLWQNAAVFAAILAAGTILFAYGKMGGGDVKLFAAVGLWCDFRTALVVLAAVFITGGVLALLVIATRTAVPAAASGRLAALKRGAGIPYGVAIGAGTLLAMFLRLR